MEFVLFLCAALSALTGAITGARTPDVGMQIERVAARTGVIAPVTSRTLAAIVQAQRVQALRAVPASVTIRPLALPVTVPIFATRRRE